MRIGLSLSFVLAAASSALATLAPASELNNRGDNAFLNCLKQAGLNPVVQGETAYDTDAAPFNRRCVFATV